MEGIAGLPEPERRCTTSRCRERCGLRGPQTPAKFTKLSPECPRTGGLDTRSVQVRDFTGGPVVRRTNLRYRLRASSNIPKSADSLNLARLPSLSSSVLI